MDKKTTHFGYKTIAREEKAAHVKDVFDSVSSRYDVMNDLMSAGLHRLWKKYTIEKAAVKRGQIILDLAGGTGDLAKAFSKQVGEDGHVVLADINLSMLKEGRARLIDAGVSKNLSIVQLNAENLPFPKNSFDLITIAFGLRNVTEKQLALESIYKALKPGGKLLILEFSKPISIMQPLYDLYSFKILPFLGELVTNDAESYRYLAESIRMHPDQDTLIGMMKNSGLERCRYQNLTGGIVALHEGYKF
ncbi:bifunctional demethylmenaquinone methyltransferase/2-methoxy-6-polyprenyl-1,4-benzoquinol methylase UbiE [Woeseiaceae bacterium]|nr:bifunctional demethylmenaquinone methyltransferase/2-methoxy-6-polyprenyl-1,4-benzoquinol methylase UbiE [Woeseiaceae bacterium]|tara:strand:+ start:262 stop:1005 length:744 start_codon:yes stop_codon:yes gene_type:complete